MSQLSRFNHAFKISSIALIFGLIVSLAAAYFIGNQNQSIIKASLNNITAQLTDDVNNRLVLYQYGLRNTRGIVLINGEENLTKEQFFQFSTTDDINMEFPGARGFGFIRRVKPDKEADFVEQAKRNGWPEFSVRQLAPHNDERYIIQYVEPLERNQAAIGLDIASEQNRFTAAKNAYLTGKTTITGPITLVQATGSPLQAFLILMPIYKHSSIPLTQEKREAEAIGWSYAPLIAEEMFVDLDLFQQTVQFSIADITHDSAAAAFFQTEITSDTFLTDYSQSTTREVLGRTWQFTVTANNLFINNLHLTKPSFVFINVFLVSLLLAVLLGAFAFNNRRKQLLLEDNARRANILEHSLDAIISYDCDGFITSWNQGAESIFDYQEADVIGRRSVELIVAEESIKLEVSQFDDVLSGKPLLNHVGQHIDRHGNILATSTTALAIYSDTGFIIGVSQTIRDITAQQDAQKQMQTLNANLESKITQRTGALEQALTENRILLDAIDQQLLYSVTDINGVILSVNDNLCESTGYDRDELIGKTHAILKSAEHDSVFWQAMWEQILSGQPWHGEICNYDRDGNIKWFDSVISPVFNEENKIERFIALRIDITERKNTQLEKDKLGALLTSILAAASEVSIISTDETGIITIFNRGAERLLGYDHSELVGKHSPALLHVPAEVELRAKELSAEFNADIAGFDAFVYKARTQGPETRIWTYVRKDGSHCQVSLSVSAIRDTNDQLVGFLGIAVDIDLMLSQQAALSSVSQHLATAADVAELGIWSWDIQADSLEWNDRMFDMYDHPLSLREKGLTYQDWLMRVHPEDTPSAEISLKNAVEKKGVYDPIFRIVTSQNEVRYIQAAAQVTYDKYDQPIKVVGINRDITKQRELEQTLRLAKNNADAANEAKSAFLANMSHEIRTPMNAVLGMLQLMQHTDMTSQQSSYINKTVVAAKSLLGLLNDILDFSKIDAGKLDLDLHPCSIEAIMRELGVLLSANIRNNNVEVIFDLSPTLPKLIQADQLRLKQILLNLAANAIKFTQQGYVIVKVVVLTQSSTSVELRISVIDTGIGISADQLTNIFQGFVQAESSTSRRFGGTGLGLSITKRLVELMGANLHVESEFGKGSQFWFDAEFELIPEPYLQPKNDLSQHHILLVDDSEMNRKILARTLTAQGATVLQANSGEEALTIIDTAITANTKIDAILLDWRMPKMNGLTVAHEVVGRYQSQSAPAIIMLTAYGEEVMLESKSLSTQPFTCLLTKPVTSSLMLETISRAINGIDENSVINTSKSLLLDKVDILVVEDNLLNRQVIDELLSIQGAQVTLAKNGIEGVNQVVENTHQFDIVIMDMQMPEMDGLEATRRIRADGRFNHLPILAMTANASAQDKHECLKAGMDDHVGKPIDMTLLIPRILKLIGRDIEADEPVTLNDELMDVNDVGQSTAIPLIETAESILSRFGGESEFLAEVIDNFETEMQTQLVILKQAFEISDIDMLRNVAHTIKGTSANIGATLLASLAAELELNCEKADISLQSKLWIESMGEHIIESTQQLKVMFPHIKIEAQSDDNDSNLLLSSYWDKQAMHVLIQQLKEQNLDALDNVDRLMIDIKSNEQWAVLKTQIDNLEFEKALATAKAILGDK